MASPDHEEPENHQFVQEIDYNEIQRLEIVGEGSFGVVYKGIWRGNYVAVKNITAEAEKKAFSVEVRQLSRVDHENIVKLYGVCTKVFTCLVMEYAEGGSLFNVLHCAPKIHYTMANAMSWVYQCARGVEYLHSMKPKPLIHRDLKPPNLLLINGGTLLKICDFGTAADKSTYMTNNKGSAAWMAPEVFASSNYTEKCDVYSWGIILWEVLSRKRPFFNFKNVNAYTIMWLVYKGNRPPLIRNCPPAIEQLMVQCWNKDAALRPSMEEVVEKMKIICDLLPGGDEPLQILDGDDVLYISDNDDNDDDDDEEEFDDDKMFKSYTTNGDNRVKSLPQPSERMRQPLTLEINPNSWDLNENYDNDLELQTMPGFDRMVPKSDSKSTVQAGTTATTTITTPTTNTTTTTTTMTKTVQEDGHESTSSTDPDLDKVYLLLDPPLRPASPDFNDPESLALFEKHKQMAQEYFKVETELALLTQRKNKLLTETTEEQQRRRDHLKQLQSEKESLIMVRELLRKQKEYADSSRNSGDSWVLVSRDSESNEH